MNPDCDRIELQLPAYVAGELGDAEAAPLRAHLEICPACREQAESLRLLHGAMLMSPLPAKLEPARVAAIQQRLQTARPTAAPSAMREPLWTRLRSLFPAPRPATASGDIGWLASLGRLAIFVLIPLVFVALLLPAGQMTKHAAFRTLDSRAKTDWYFDDASAPAKPTSARAAEGEADLEERLSDDFIAGNMRRPAAGEKRREAGYVGPITVSAASSASPASPATTPPPPPPAPSMPAVASRWARTAEPVVAQSAPARPVALESSALTGHNTWDESGAATEGLEGFKVNSPTPVVANGSISERRDEQKAEAGQRDLFNFAAADKKGAGTVTMSGAGTVTIAAGTRLDLNGRTGAGGGGGRGEGDRGGHGGGGFGGGIGGVARGVSPAAEPSDRLSRSDDTASRLSLLGGDSDEPVVMKGLYEGRSSVGRDLVSHLDKLAEKKPAEKSVPSVMDFAEAKPSPDVAEPFGNVSAAVGYASAGTMTKSGDLRDITELSRAAGKAIAKNRETANETAPGWFGTVAADGAKPASVVTPEAPVTAEYFSREELQDASRRGRGNVAAVGGVLFTDSDGEDMKSLGFQSGSAAGQRGQTLVGGRAAVRKEIALGDRYDVDGGALVSDREEDLRKSMKDVAKQKSAPVSGAEAKEELVALRTEIPKPMFVGTPVPIKVPNLEIPGQAPGLVTYEYDVKKADMERYKRGNTYDGLTKQLEEKGLKTPAGSTATYDPETEKLVVKSNLAAVDAITSMVAGKEQETVSLYALNADAPRPVAPRPPAGFNPYIESAADAFSTFSIDVDTASYTLTRRAIEEGRLPDAEQVRTEEIVNAFDYDYAPPAHGAFAMHAELAPSPFRAPLDLLKVGIQGRLPGRDAKKAAVLTLVIDSSGSMDTPDRLGRIRAALKMLVAKLQPQDSVAIVAFNTEPRLILDRTAGADKAALLAAIDAIAASGSTQLEGGMRLGYQVAARGFVSGAANRVILMSDGVANLGAATAVQILASVEDYRRQGIYLTVLGFGSGTYDDAMLMQLADKGDGMYAFVDSDEEARRLLVDQWEQTLHVIAKDVKIQIEFNPDRVVRWRQIGYEKRQLTKQDFRNDAVDAGEVGSGQAVTALYDLELKQGEAGFQPVRSPSATIATLRVRYKDPDTGKVTELERRITDANRRANFANAPARFRVAACAAEFAELLRVSPYTAASDFGAVIDQLRPAANQLPLDQRVQELVRLAERARGLAQ